MDQYTGNDKNYVVSNTPELPDGKTVEAPVNTGTGFNEVPNHHDKNIGDRYPLSKKRILT